MKLKSMKKILSILFLGFIAYCMLYPIIWDLKLSLKPNSIMFVYPPENIFKPTLGHYGTVFESQYLMNLKNSLIVSLGAVFSSFLIGIPAAYSLKKTKSNIRKPVMLILLVTRMVPGMAFVIPYFVALSYFKLLDTYIGLILPYIMFNIGLIIWSMSDFFETIPLSLEEAAYVDGASTSRVFWEIILPLCKPGLVSTAILAFIMSWNEFMYALILTRRDVVTAPVGIMNFMAYEGIDWGTVAAGSILFMVPVILFAFILKKYLLQGLLGGATKG
jgi:multiple sugar transport system permease protein